MELRICDDPKGGEHVGEDNEAAILAEAEAFATRAYEVTESTYNAF
jgi:hypothetical protein